MGTSSKELFTTLSGLAGLQEGYFSAKQAVMAGYADSVHNYHVRNGDWEKVYRGIYRLRGHPAGDWPELVIWSLWSRGRGDEPLGVYSHETAMAIHGLGRKTPRLHMTVPSTFRKNCELPFELILHKADLAPEDMENKPGYRVTTPDRTRRDLGLDTGSSLHCRDALQCVSTGSSSWCNGVSFNQALEQGLD